MLYTLVITRSSITHYAMLQEYIQMKHSQTLCSLKTSPKHVCHAYFNYQTRWNSANFWHFSWTRQVELIVVLALFFRNEDKQRIQVQCFPLYSILLAVGRTKIDFFSFDMECAAENVLESIPMDEVDIKLFVIKYHLGDEYQKQLRFNKLLGFFDKIGGYTFVGTHRDMVAVFQKVQKESWMLSRFRFQIQKVYSR